MYSKLSVRDYVVVDLRVSQDGEPTIVQQDTKSVTVLFKAGDFTTFWGLEQKC
jgi:hypothetical protein